MRTSFQIGVKDGTIEKISSDLDVTKDKVIKVEREVNETYHAY